MKKRTKLLVIACAMVLLCGAGLFLWKEPQSVYVAMAYLGIGEEKTLMQPGTPGDLLSKTLEELAEDAGVTIDQSMMLVSEKYVIPDSFEWSISAYKDTDVQMNTCIQNAYMQLAERVKEATGERLLISSAYRTEEKQQELYREDPTTANAPGTSEHQTGLALDVYVKYYASYGFLKSDAGKYINSNCWRDGFIIRYPVYGKGETGVKYEPWHLRYVGQPHAKVIYNNHLTLEEYLESLEYGKWYRVDDYWISRQNLEEGTLQLPQHDTQAVISPDNTGSYIVTVRMGGSDIS